MLLKILLFLIIAASIILIVLVFKLLVRVSTEKAIGEIFDLATARARIRRAFESMAQEAEDRANGDYSKIYFNVE